MATNPNHSLFAPALLTLLAATSLPAQATPTVEARLAAAKLHEARGELSKAADELQQALAAATEAQRTEVVAQQARLRTKLGAEAGAPRAANAQEPGPQRDPVQELIAVIDSGAQAKKPVSDACEQLQSLGDLAVPPLVAALPNLGPFGITNAMWVLQHSADARVAAALQQLVADNDAAVVTSIALRLYDMRREVAVPVAKGLIGRELSADASQCLFRVLRKHEPEAETTRAFGMKLAARVDTQGLVSDQLDKNNDAVAIGILAELVQQTTGRLRTSATDHWLSLRQDLQEADALEILATLDARDRSWVARRLSERHPQWIAVALVALPCVEQDPAQAASDWFGRIEWHRRPDDVAALLLAVPWKPGSPGTQSVQRLLADLLTRGWQPPAAVHEVLDRLMMVAGPDVQSAYVRSIPAAAEERVLATWQRLDAAWRRQLVLLAVAQERPWHRLVARHLAACTQAGEVAHEYLRRDWTGAPADVVATLVALVERFPSAPDGSVFPWHAEVVKQYRRCRELPASVVLPMVRQGNREAWTALVERHPQDALTHARGDAAMTLLSHAALLDALLGEHGTVADVPLALRLARGSGAASSWPGIQRLLMRAGRGRVDVVALAAEPELNWLHSAAHAAAEGLTVAQLGELLPLLPKLEQSVRSAVHRAIAPQLRAEHGLPIATAMQAWFAQPNPEWNTFEVLNVWLGKAADPRCLSVLRPLLAVDAEQRPCDWIARTMLDIAGDQRRALVEELLASPVAKVVAVAAEAPELRGDAALLAKAKVAVQRVAGEAEFDDDLFVGLSAETAADWARAILGDERLPTFRSGIVQAALVALRRTGAAAAAPLLARGALHRDADTRARTARELGNLFQREAAPFLIDLLKDEDPNVRKQAQESLDQLAKYLDARAEWEKRLK